MEVYNECRKIESGMFLDTFSARSIYPADVHVLKLVLLCVGLIQQLRNVDFLWPCPPGRIRAVAGDRLPPGLSRLGVDPHQRIADVDEAVLGPALPRRHLAVPPLDARYPLQVVQDQPLLLPRPLLQHVPLQTHESEAQPLSHDLGGGLEQRGGLLEVAPALLQAELDVGADAVGAQLLEELGHGGVVAVVERLGQEDGVGDVAVVVSALLDLLEGPLLGPAVDVGQRLQHLRLRPVVLVVLGLHVHHAAQHRPVGSDPDRRRHQLVPVLHEGAVRRLTLRKVPSETHYVLLFKKS
jgi:hypothetical protein